MIGQLLDGRYQVIQVLGAGGFGQTYIALDMRRPGSPKCVVKVLKPSSSDPESLQTARRLFSSEAEILEQLGSHDYIPRLLAYQEQEFYLVQEYIEGHPLSMELLPGERWMVNRVIQLLQEVLSILEFVHSRGVIHRDIKPDNIIRRAADNRLVLVDFGAVKQIRNQTYINPAQSSATIAIGTPGYMPTEQAQGRPRPNSDLYALGMIAIQALTGLMPLQLHEDPQTGEIIWQHLVSISPGLATVLTRMTRYHFKDRYQSATEALQALRQLMSGQPVSEPSGPPAPPSPVSEQKTTPVVPRYPSPPPVNVPPTPPARSTSSNKLPLLLGTSIATLVFMAGLAVVLNSQSNSDKDDNSDDKVVVQQEESCIVDLDSLSTLNVRSAPQGQVIGQVQQGTKIALTGAEKSGWVEISSPSKGWVFRKYVSCPSAVAVSPKPTPQVTPKVTPKASPETPKPVDQSSEIFVKAEEKFQSGDLESAITLIRSIPINSSTYQKAQETIQRWRQDWAKAEEIFNQAQQAFNEGRWDDVLAAQQNPAFPDLPYWETQLKQLIAIAAQRKQEAENQKPPESPPPESPSPSPSVTPSAESPTPTVTPSESPSPTVSPSV